MKKFLFALGTFLHTVFATIPSKSFQRDVVAAVIWAEARSEGARGMRGVAEVIRNRAAARHTTPYLEVVRKKQFSCLNGTNPIDLAEKYLEARSQFRVRGNDAHAATIADALATMLVDRTLRSDITKGADHYHDNSIVKPDWVPHAQIPVKIGTLHFYNLQQ